MKRIQTEFQNRELENNIMIGYITGKVISKKPTKSLIDVNGIGYLVNTSINTFEKIC